MNIFCQIASKILKKWEEEQAEIRRQQEEEMVSVFLRISEAIWQNMVIAVYELQYVNNLE